MVRVLEVNAERQQEAGARQARRTLRAHKVAGVRVRGGDRLSSASALVLNCSASPTCVGLRPTGTGESAINGLHMP